MKEQARPPRWPAIPRRNSRTVALRRALWRGEQIPLVDGDHTGLVSFLNQAGDLPILRGHARAGVDDQHAKVRAPDAFLRAHDAENLRRIVALAAVPDAGGVDEHVILPAELARHVHRITRRARHRRSRWCVLRPESRWSVNSYPRSGDPLAPDTARAGASGTTTAGSASGSRCASRCRATADASSPQRCGHAPRSSPKTLLEPQSREFAFERGVHVLVDLVDDEQHGLIRAAP